MKTTKIKAALPDFDGTLITEEILDIVCGLVGKKEESRKLNEEFQSGKSKGLGTLIHDFSAGLGPWSSMNGSSLLRVGLFIPLLLGFAEEDFKETGVNNQITVTAVLLEYIPNAMSDAFDDGGFASYDATRIQILAPPKFARLQLSIYHNDEVPKDSLWRACGQNVLFEIDSTELAVGTIIFDGAVTHLRHAS